MNAPPHVIEDTFLADTKKLKVSNSASSVLPASRQIIRRTGKYGHNVFGVQYTASDITLQRLSELCPSNGNEIYTVSVRLSIHSMKVLPEPTTPSERLGYVIG